MFCSLSSIAWYLTRLRHVESVECEGRVGMSPGCHRIHFGTLAAALSQAVSPILVPHFSLYSSYRFFVAGLLKNTLDAQVPSAILLLLKSAPLNMSNTTSSNLLLATHSEANGNPPRSAIENDLAAELVEMISLLLPVSQVLHLQRLSKGWNRAIKDSPKLQRALFMRPALSGDETKFQVFATNSQEWQDSEDEDELTEFPDRTKRGYRPLLNDFLRPFFYKLNGRYLFVAFGQAERVRTGKPLKFDIETLLHPGNSWRQMLILQPPCKVLHYSYRDDRTDEWLKGRIENGSGVTMGDLMDRYVQLVEARQGRRCVNGMSGMLSLHIRGLCTDDVEVWPRSTLAWELLDAIENKRPRRLPKPAERRSPDWCSRES